MQIRLKNIKFWSDIPDYWKYTPPKSKVKYESKPTDKGLASILADFASDDDLRPAMTGIFFDKDNIVATDAHKLFIVPNKGDYEGLYETQSDKKIEYKYPDYKVIISNNNDRKPYLIDVLKLKTYLNVVIKAKINSFFKVVMAVSENDQKMAFDAEKLIIVLDTFQKLGYEKVYVGYESPTRMLLFSPEKEYITNPQKSYGKVPLGLCMPVMTLVDENLGVYNIDTDYSLEVYYDISTDNIYNADKTIAQDWKPKTDWGIPYWSKEEQKLVNKITTSGSSKILPILQNVKVSNKKLHCTNLEVHYEINNFDVEDGLYLIVNGALVNSTDDIDSFPAKPDGEYVSQHFPYPKGFQEAVNFVGDDDLRPIMNGVHYKVSDKIEIEATDAHIAIHLEVGNIDENSNPSMDVIINNPTLVSEAIDVFKNEEYSGDLLLFISVSKSNSHVKIERINAPYRAITVRNEYGRFPNIKDVKPDESTESLVINCAELNKLITGMKGEQKKNSVAIDPQQNETIVYSKNNDELIKVGSVKSKLISTEERNPKNSYMLLGGNTEDNIKVYKYNAIKDFTKVAARYSDSSSLCRINAMNKKSVQIADLPDLNEIELSGRGAKPKPKRAEIQSKPQTSQIEDKKKELEQAIKGLEILAKKGNKIAETTLKGLKILLKKM